MPAAPLAATLRRFARAAAGDAELLADFRERRDEAAFAELVRRYAPLVAGVCRRTLGQAQDAEDAFQAAFLVLARKAHAVDRPERLAGWLHTVALRAAREVRSMRQRQRRSDSVRPRPEAVTEEMRDADLASLLDEEIARLPEHYRLALVRCELQGQSRAEVAAALKVPEGTLSSRLAEAKRRLARRLQQRGVTAGAAGLAAVLVPQAEAGFSAARVAGLARSAVALVAGRPAVVAAPALAAADVVVKSMVASKLKGLAVVAVLIALTGGALTLGPGDQPRGSVAKAAEPPRTVTQPDPKALVAQLGSAKYAEREEATRMLRQLGAKALPAVKEGTNSAEPEVARRCRTLLPQIRADEWFRVREALTARDRPEIDHPAWKRFKQFAGDDAGSRRLFAEMIADEKRAKLLDEVFDNPDAAGRLYAAEVARVENLCRYGVSRNEELAKKGMVVGSIAYHPPNGELATLLLIGTFPATAKVVPDDGTGERVMLFDSFLKMGLGARDVRPAMQRLLAAWTVTRGHGGAIDAALQLAREWWMAEFLPAVRRLAADEKLPAKVRAEAILAVGQLGDKSDVALLRRIAESPSAAEPFDWFNEILKGREKFDSLWGRERLGGPKPTPEEWKKAYAEADIRTGSLALADCAWAAAVYKAGGDISDMGFLWRWRLRQQQGTFPPWAHAYGFPTPEARTAAYAKAKTFLTRKAP